MEVISKQIEKISRVSHGKIPVAEDSPVYSLFAERRKLAERLNRDMLTEEDNKKLLEYFNYTEEQIKKYLCL
mgnify:CR=1 FL=1